MIRIVREGFGARPGGVRAKVPGQGSAGRDKSPQVGSAHILVQKSGVETVAGSDRVYRNDFF